MRAIRATAVATLTAVEAGVEAKRYEATAIVSKVRTLYSSDSQTELRAQALAAVRENIEVQIHADADYLRSFVYRPANLIGAGVVYTVMAGGRPLVKLEPGGYIALVEDARAMEFTAKTEAETSITLDLEAGETYYLKGGVGPGFVVGRPKLTLVDDTVGASEIQKCKKLGPASLGLATP